MLDGGCSLWQKRAEPRKAVLEMSRRTRALIVKERPWLFIKRNGDHRAGAEADLHWVYAPPDSRRELCVRVAHWICRDSMKRVVERNHRTFKTRLAVGLRPAPLHRLLLLSCDGLEAARRRFRLPLWTRATD